MASGNINLTSERSAVKGRISWSSSINQVGNYSLVTAKTYVILNGWGIQGTGSGEWYENGTLKNTFSPKVNVAYGGSGTTLVYTKSNIKVNHNSQGKGSIRLGANMSFSFAGVNEISGSGLCTLDNIPRYSDVTSIDINLIDCNAVHPTVYMDSQIDRFWYSLDNGTTWILENDGSSGAFQAIGFGIYNLVPNTSYTIKFKTRRNDSKLEQVATKTLTFTTDNIATITEAPNIVVGNNATIKYINPCEGAVSVCVADDNNVVLAGYRSVTSSPYTFEFTQSELNAIYSKMANVTSMDLRYYIRTIQNGETYYSYVTRTFTINQSTNLPSAPSNITYSDTNASVLALTGDSSKILLGYSNVRVSIGTASTAKNQATIKRYSITDGTTTKEISATGAAPYVDIINEVKRASIEAYVFDSRGFSSKSSINLTTLDYKSPVINSNTILKRVGGVGSSVTFVFSGSIWNKSFGDVTNEIVNFRYKKLPSTSTNWESVDWINIESSKYTIDSNGIIQNVSDAIFADFTIGVEYNVKIELTDRLNQKAEIILNVNSGEPIVAYNKTKKLVGVGKIPNRTLPSGSIDVKGSVVAGSFKTNELVDEEDKIYIKTNTWDTVVAGGKNERVLFRPKGSNSDTNQAILDSEGTFIAKRLSQNNARILGYNGTVNLSYTFNQAIYTGLYRVSAPSTVEGAPYTGGIWGTLEVVVSDCTYWDKSSNWIWQVFRDTNGNVYTRKAVESGSFSNWIKKIESAPVGSVVVTSTNTNPGTSLGGTWSLIDKQFKSQYLYSEDTTYFTRTNVSANGIRLNYDCHTINIEATVTTNTALSDTSVTLGTFKQTAMGIVNSDRGSGNIYTTGWTDGGNAFVMLTLDTAGNLASGDVIVRGSGTTVASGSSIAFNAMITVPYNKISDSWCDKFFWKRTA